MSTHMAGRHDSPSAYFAALRHNPWKSQDKSIKSKSSNMTTPKSSESKGPVKEKLRSIMDAASALTSLGDESENENNSRPSSPAKDGSKAEEPKETTVETPDADKEVKEEAKSDLESGEKRYLPDHKKADAALTFPEKMMKLMRYAETQDTDGEFCVGWVDDGKSFIIRKPDEFTRNVVPKFFKPTKFSSFTRKLYRWGFRQINRGIGPDDPIIFGNEFFQRDSAELIAKMRSITAAGTRKHESKTVYSGMKHPMEGMSTFDESSHKRMMLDHLYQHKASMMNPNQGLYGGMTANSLSLTSALRPNMVPQAAMNMGGNQGMHGQGFDMMMNNGAPHQMNQFIPQGNKQQYHMQGAPQGQNQQMYPNSASTAEIVNAAIAALRYAN